MRTTSKSKVTALLVLAIATASGSYCAALDFGLSGAGQTIAVIDSGLAYDHPAFADRYVGGWDFAENDADPYDDQSEKLGHGTRVAGVAVAGDTGVASGADVVSLRVFNDQGITYFQWVEEALRWTIENRNTFENPITAVNISLGTDWNSAEPPVWATLENEFQELEELGVYITTSAGNDFAEFRFPGLTYPAASPHVTAAMALASNNSQLAGYSQRHTNAIAAPGTQRRVPVPDYAGDGDGQSDDWKSSGGTSVAAPYLAGASVLVREAFQMVGVENVMAETINQHLRATGDWVFDPATEQNYSAINLTAALEAIIDNEPGDFNRDGVVNTGDYTVWRDGLGDTYSRSDYQVWRNAMFGSATILPGDFNRDGSVDTADYTVWQEGLGTTYEQADYYLWKKNFGRNSQSVVLGGDFNGDGVVDAADYSRWRDGLGTVYSQVDYQLWRSNFGRTAVSASASARSSTTGAFSTVPEPLSLTVLLAFVSLVVLIAPFRCR